MVRTGGEDRGAGAMTTRRRPARVVRTAGGEDRGWSGPRVRIVVRIEAGARRRPADDTAGEDRGEDSGEDRGGGATTT